jgi:hypothetical protein
MRCLDGRRPTWLPLLAVAVAVLLASAVPGDAQVLYGSIVGTVTDASGAAVPGATVTAINQGTNLAREATTRSDGTYSFVNVLPGEYTIRVTLQGFKEYVKESVPVSANVVARVPVMLEVGALTEAVTVQSERTLLQTDSGAVQGELKAEAIEELPLGNYRNYQELLNLVPGTTPAGFQNAITDTPARSLTTNVNGTARNNNNTRLDGATDVYVWLPHHAVYVAPADTVDTVNISTSSFDAEQGMAGGAAVTVLTKSGTNEFHGSGTYLFENDSLRARNFFNSGDKPNTSRKIGSVTLGGPIIKDKLFFFGAWEGQYNTNPSTRTGTVPTAAMRAGDFSAYGTTIYDPATGNPDGTGRRPFRGNVIPADRIDPIAQQIQSRIPMPDPGTGTSSNYSRTGLVDFNRNNYDFKLNYNISSAAQVWAKFSQMNADVYSDMWLGNPDQGGIGGYGFGDGSGTGNTRVRIGTVGMNWTLSPNFLLDATASLMRFDQTSLPPDYGTNYGTDVFGIPGTNGAGGGNGDIRYSGLPYFDISSYEPFGGVDGWTPLFRNDRSYNLSVNGTYIKASHDMRFGVDIVRMELNHWQPELGNPRGSLVFSGGATALGPTGSPDQFNSYAQFLLGLTTSVNKSLQYQLSTGREWQYGIYFRDRWQVNKSLTLTLGLRYEAYPLMTRKDRGIEYYDDTTNQTLLCGLGGNPTDCGIKVKHPHFLPRVGFSYRLDDDNVVRGGYGITISPMPFSRPLRSFYPNVPANNYVSASDYIPFGTIESGIPLYYGPDLSSGSIDTPLTADQRTPYGDHVNRPYIQSWNVTYERRLPWDMSISAGYVGTKTTHQLGFYNINASAAGLGQNGQVLFQRFGRSASTYRFDGWLSSNYHSLQVALNKPFSKGFFLKAAYTWSRAMNRTDDDGWATVNWNDPAALYKNYGPAGYDRAHIFQLGFVADLPFGRGSSSPLAAIVKDWSVNGLFSAFTGTPFTVTSSDASVNSPGNSQSADLVGTPNKLGGIGGDSPYYDPSAWAPVTEVRYGNTGRNSVRGPGMWNIDFSLFRRFPLGERISLELRAEAFNLTNTPHFRNPNGDASSGSFMTITSTGTSNSGLDAPERQFRLGARIQF